MKEDYLSKTKLVAQLEFRQAVARRRAEDTPKSSPAHPYYAAQLAERTALLELVRQMPGEAVKKKHWLLDLIEGAD